MNPFDKILLGVGAAIALVVAIAIVWLSFANAHLHAALAIAQANVTACQITNDDFRQKAEKQDQAIAALQNESAARAKRASEAEQAAQKTAAPFQAEADRLAGRKNAGDDCKAAADLLNHFIAGIK
jgi:hypothetical protein